MWLFVLACHGSDEPDEAPGFDADTIAADSAAHLVDSAEPVGTVDCSPPALPSADPAWDLGAWLAAHPAPIETTPQAGSPEPVALPSRPEELDAVRAAWSAMVGPIPESCVPLDLVEETLDLTSNELPLLDQSRYTVHRVTYRGAHGQRIPAYVLVPLGLPGKAPGVLVMHQSNPTCGKKEPLGVCGAVNLDFARDLADRGFVTLAPDSIGYGERAAESWNYGYEYADAAPLLALFPDATLTGLRISDARRALDVLASMPEVDADRLGMIGHSNGGIETLFDAAFDPRIRCAVSNAGPNLIRRETIAMVGLEPGIARWAGFGYLPALGFWDGARDGLPVDMHQLYAMVSPRGLYAVQIEDDTIAPAVDRAAVVFAQAEESFSELGGDFVGQIVASGLTPECRDEWGPPLCLGALFDRCVATGEADCALELASVGMTAACVADWSGVAYNCAWDLYWNHCREDGQDYNECVAELAVSGFDEPCIQASFESGCRRDHGWYPEVEAEAYPWLEDCLRR
jgi:dienelactone hydrolase